MSVYLHSYNLGDTITKVLAEKLKPKRVIFLSNVHGIYTLPPEDPDAKLITDIALNSDGTIYFPQTNCSDHDGIYESYSYFLSLLCFTL